MDTGLATAVLDAQTASKMTAYLTSLAYAAGPVEIHIDFTHVEWIGSAAVGLVIGLHRQVSGAGGRLVLVNVNERVADVLRLTRLDRILEIRPKAACNTSLPTQESLVPLDVTVTIRLQEQRPGHTESPVPPGLAANLTLLQTRSAGTIPRPPHEREE